MERPRPGLVSVLIAGLSYGVRIVLSYTTESRNLGHTFLANSVLNFVHTRLDSLTPTKTLINIMVEKRDVEHGKRFPDI